MDPTLVRSCLVVSANKMCNLLKINKNQSKYSYDKVEGEGGDMWVKEGNS